jgi:hypothetical protein
MKGLAYWLDDKEIDVRFPADVKIFTFITLSTQALGSAHPPV